MTRVHGALALLLAAALAWAYALTRSDGWPARGPNQPISVLAVEPRDVLSVEFAELGSRVVLKSDPAMTLANGAPSVWIKAEGPAAARDAPQPPKLPPSAPSKTQSPAPAALAAPERAIFRGGAVAASLLGDLARMPATRDLGRVDARRLESFGLAKPTATLRVERRGGEPLRLTLGNGTLAGATRYAQLEPDGHVFLVPQAGLRQLEHPRRLMDREWLPFNLMEARLVEAKLGGRTLTVWRLVNAPRTEPQRWSRKRDAAAGEPAAQAWMQMLAGVKVLDYPDAAAPAAGAETMLEVTVHRTEPASGADAAAGAGSPGAPRDGEPVVLRVYRPGPKAEAGQLRAVSGYTGRPVMLSAPAVQAALDQARALLDSR